MMFYNIDSFYKRIIGCGIGAVLGYAAGAVATVWGGYEIGSTINDCWDITSTVGRGALDLVVMGVIAKPVFKTGVYVGMAAGVIVAEISHHVIEKTKDLVGRVNEDEQN